MHLKTGMQSDSRIGNFCSNCCLVLQNKIPLTLYLSILQNIRPSRKFFLEYQLLMAAWISSGHAARTIPADAHAHAPR